MKGLIKREKWKRTDSEAKSNLQMTKLFIWRNL